MTSTSTNHGADFSYQMQADGIIGYIAGGDYTEEQTDKLSSALMDALRDEVDGRLPDGCTWQPQTSEFLFEIGGVEPPEHDEMKELFATAWTAVEARYEEIETAALA